MPLPDSYILKPDAVPAYFDAILDAQPPERFSARFLENLGFTTINDRLLIGVLKDIGFLSRDAAPQPRYFAFLDRSKAKQVLAEGVREGFGDLFAINTKANEFSLDDAKNKLRTLYAGKKTDLVINRIARTFRALCEYADFTAPAAPAKIPPADTTTPTPLDSGGVPEGAPSERTTPLPKLKIAGLQYHINIVLPETRDQATYDAIFKSLREHLG
jgi:Family of unknown function (DUF5343)